MTRPADVTVRPGDIVETRSGTTYILRNDLGPRMRGRYVLGTGSYTTGHRRGYADVVTFVRSHQLHQAAVTLNYLERHPGYEFREEFRERDAAKVARLLVEARERGADSPAAIAEVAARADALLSTLEV